MARERVARIRIEAAGSDKVRAAMKGISTDADKVRASIRAAGGEWNKLGAISEAGARKMAATAAATSRSIAGGYRNAEHQYRTELQRSSAEAAESYRSRETSFMRGQTAMRAEAQRTGASIRSSIGGGVASFAAGAGIGAALGAVALVTGTLKSVGSQLVANLHEVTSALGSRVGVQGIAERTASAAEIDRDIGRIAVQAFGGGTDAELQAGRQRITDAAIDVAERRGIDVAETVATLALLQTRFSNLPDALQQLDRFAAIAQGSGDALRDLAQSSGEAANILGVTPEQNDEYMNVMTEQGREGRITPGEVNRNFTQEMGNFRTFRGTQGIGLAREFGAFVQSVAQGGGDPSVAKTQMGAIITGLSDPDTQDRLARVGVFTRDRAAGDRGNRRTGARRPMADIIADMQASPGFRTSEQINGIFGRQEAVLGLQTLMRVGAPQFRAYENADAAHGARLIDQGFRVYREGEFGQAESTARRGQVEGIRNLRPRAAQARGALSFAESLRQTPGMWGGWLGQQLADSSLLTEGGSMLLQDQGGSLSALARLAGARGGIAARLGAAGLGDIFAGTPGDLTIGNALGATREAQTAKAAEIRDLRLAEGSVVGLRAGTEVTVNLSPGSVTAIARAVGGGGPPGPVPNQGRRTPGGPARQGT